MGHLPFFFWIIPLNTFLLLLTQHTTCHQSYSEESTIRVATFGVSEQWLTSFFVDTRPLMERLTQTSSMPSKWVTSRFLARHGLIRVTRPRISSCVCSEKIPRGLMRMKRSVILGCRMYESRKILGIRRK